MKMEVHLQQRLEQRMHLSQQMLQNLELLQLPIMELRDVILKELEENPTVEETQDVEERETPATEAEREPQTEAQEFEESAKTEMIESVEEQWADSERRTRRSDSAEDAERRMEMLNNASEGTASLRDHLINQLSLLELPEEDRAYCEHVIQNIDDNGYLSFSLEDVVGSLPEALRREAPEILARKVEHALTIIQQMEPRGVGARSIKECILLQLNLYDKDYPLLRKLIENHFEDIGANRLPRIAKAFAADPEVLAELGIKGEPDPNFILEYVKSLIAHVSKLNPKPGATYSADKVPKVFPEVIIKRVDGKYEIMLEDGWLPPISVNRNYEEKLKERKLTDKEREFVLAMAKSEKFPREQREMLAELGRGKRIMPGDRARFAEMAKDEKLLTDQERTLAADLARDPAFNKDERDYIKQKMDAGRKLITAIEQRRGTIYRITSEILKRQMDFFENGVENLKPLKMQEVADALGIHLSTVSRAISEKWVETPRGIFPLKFFFASAAPRAEPVAGSSPFSFPTSDGGGGAGEPQDEQTRLALMEKIREILEGEDKKEPLSDLEIVRQLKDKHRISAARRTIAKYREEMNIPSSRMRKQY
jgi:RNA polymerase sigma-54 factor